MPINFPAEIYSIQRKEIKLQEEANKYHQTTWHFKNKSNVSKEDLRMIKKWEENNKESKVELLYRLNALAHCQYCTPTSKSANSLIIVFEDAN